MPKFPSAIAAYCWSYEILDAWRNGSAFDPDPEIHRGGTGAMGAVLVALDVEGMAKAACKANRTACRWHDGDCFTNWFVPLRNEPAPQRMQRHEDFIRTCEELFTKMLRDEDWLE